MGSQIKGDATVEGFINALKKGARLVERKNFWIQKWFLFIPNFLVDCYDGDNGEPIITHGFTLVSPILLKNAVQAINDYAFEASPYVCYLRIYVCFYCAPRFAMPRFAMPPSPRLASLCPLRRASLRRASLRYARFVTSRSFALLFARMRSRWNAFYLIFLQISRDFVVGEPLFACSAASNGRPFCSNFRR